MMIPLEREGRRLPHKAILQALPSPCAYAWGVSISSLRCFPFCSHNPRPFTCSLHPHLIFPEHFSLPHRSQFKVLRSRLTGPVSRHTCPTYSAGSCLSEAVVYPERPFHGQRNQTPVANHSCAIQCRSAGPAEPPSNPSPSSHRLGH